MSRWVPRGRRRRLAALLLVVLAALAVPAAVVSFVAGCKCAPVRG